jgi:hypothetical protein
MFTHTNVILSLERMYYSITTSSSLILGCDYFSVDGKLAFRYDVIKSQLQLITSTNHKINQMV